MLRVIGWRTSGVQGMRRRMTEHSAAFRAATGQRLYPGTLNIDIALPMPIREHFRINGVDIGEPEQDLQFEICRLAGIWVYRIRPYRLADGGGGHGDNVLEIASASRLAPLVGRGPIEVGFFPRRDV